MKSKKYVSAPKFSYASIVLSITLTLFMVGVLGVLLIHARTISHHIKERLPVEIFLKDASQEEVKKFIETIQSYKFVKTLQYIDKDQAMNMAQKELNIQDKSLLEHHVFPASIRMTLRADYINPAQVGRIIKGIDGPAIIDEIKYPKDLLQEMHTNIEKWSTRLIGFTAPFLIIAMILIHNAVSLGIHSKRFIIRSMQLVGAKRSFIYIPFLRRSLLWGVFGGCIALIGLIFFWYCLLGNASSQYEQDHCALGGLALGVLLFGMIISSSSTYLAIRKCLRSTADELNYSS